MAITGPVGWPVGEPPRGSIDTASAPDARLRACWSETSWTEPEKSATPSAMGLPPVGISQSSGERPAAAWTAAGVSTMARRPGS